MPAPAPFEQKPPVLAEIGFVGLLLLLLVTLHPFHPPAVGTTIGVSAIETVASDVWRQITFTGVFIFAFAAAIWYRPAVFLRAIPLTVMALLGWCLLSAVWSDAGGVVFRRAVLITEVTVTPLLGVALLGPERAFSRLRLVLLIVLVANWIAIPLIPSAIHGLGEQDPKLIGNWRGLYDQKNVTGAVCTLTVLAFLFPGRRERKRSDWLVILAALVFLYFTKSKTCLALLPVAAAFGYAYRAGWKNGLDRALLAVAAVIAIGCAVTLVALNTELVTRIMADPDAFTGRTEIWNAEIAYLKDGHFLTGAGFGAIFSTGGPSPLTPYLHGRNWVAMVSNSHNGYFDMFASLGAIGFALALMALLVAPFRRFWALNFDPAKAGYFAIFIFIICHNFTEADYLSSDGVSWLVLLMVLGALRQPAPVAAPARYQPRPAAVFSRQARA